MTLAEPFVKRWTRQEFYQLGELGCFHGKRAFLLDGEIYEMSGQGNWHSVAIELADEQLRPIMPRPCWLRIQMPLEGPNDASDPEPDLAVVAGVAREFRSHPTTAILVIEVSDTTLRLDRKKAAAYAAMQVGEYWIENLADRQLEVHREPVPDSSEVYGWRYTQMFTLRDGDSIQPVSAPQATIAISDLFPARPAGKTF